MFRKIDFSLVQRNVIASPKFEKWVYCFHSILRIKSSLQMCCNPTVCFNIRVIKFKFYCNSMIPQPLANFITVFFFQKDEAGSYDNIARTQRFALSWTCSPKSVTGLDHDPVDILWFGDLCSDVTSVVIVSLRSVAGIVRCDEMCQVPSQTGP